MATKSRRGRKRKTRRIATPGSGLPDASPPAGTAADVGEVLEALLRLAAFPVQLEANRESANATMLFSTAKQVAATAGPDALVARQKLLEDTEARIDGQIAAVALFDKRLGGLGEELIAKYPEDARSFLKTRSEKLETQLADPGEGAQKAIIKAQIARAKELSKLLSYEKKTSKLGKASKTKRSSKAKA